MTGITDAESEEKAATEMTDQIFERVDKNADGKLSLEEFIEGAKVDPDLAEMLQNTWNVDTLSCCKDSDKTNPKPMKTKQNKRMLTLTLLNPFLPRALHLTITIISR